MRSAPETAAGRGDSTAYPGSSSELDTGPQIVLSLPLETHRHRSSYRWSTADGHRRRVFRRGLHGQVSYSVAIFLSALLDQQPKPHSSSSGFSGTNLRCGHHLASTLSVRYRQRPGSIDLKQPQNWNPRVLRKLQESGYDPTMFYSMPSSVPLCSLGCRCVRPCITSGA